MKIFWEGKRKKLDKNSHRETWMENNKITSQRLGAGGKENIILRRSSYGNIAIKKITKDITLISRLSVLYLFRYSGLSPL
ncbi:MAG: hypothetical protein M1467_04415 [Deltaproteobacteria bacterium]|jgi:hypothetical protein|nr:hypothetical protein [Deltaproteobacteria bacterium]